MTPSPDLLAVLREAREALESVSLALPVTQWARTIDAIGNTLARIDTALSAPEPQRWRPIDEAPKDGTLLRLFAESLIDEDFNPSGSAEGHWCDDVGWQAALWNDGADEFYTAVIYPSHFMTLPEPPK